jgi:galactokinase
MKISERFSEVFGYAPNLISAAPGRVNLIGEHIDYNGGDVLPFAIANSTYVALGARTDSKIRLASSLFPGEIIQADTHILTPLYGQLWSRYVLGVFWAVGSARLPHGFDIYIDSTVPIGSGLSSSASVEASIATALNNFFQWNMSLPDLARICQRAENDFVGMPCGIMDQAISLMAQAGQALLLDTRSLKSEQIPLDLASKGLELLVIDTQVHHELVDGGYAERRDSCEKAAETLGITTLREISVSDFESRKSELDVTTYLRAHHAVTEISRVSQAVHALRADDYEELGKLLNQSHESLRDEFTVSCPELNCAVEVANAHGALGSRMIGGGYGGSAIALIRQEDREDVESAILEAFAKNGFIAPRFFVALPSAGARIIQQG